jgi:hypothetical protein
MANYLVKPGYCLHLPPGRFVHPGEEVDLNGELEQKVLETQGWKIEPAQPEPAAVKPQKAGTAPVPETKEVPEPPKDRAVKKDKAQTK